MSAPPIVQSQEKARVPSKTPDKALPKIFSSVLPQIKPKSRVPILLPNELPQPIAKAKHAVIGTAEADNYGIALYYEREPDGGYFGFAASFGGEQKPKFHPQELPNVEPVNLLIIYMDFLEPSAAADHARRRTLGGRRMAFYIRYNWSSLRLSAMRTKKRR